MLTGAEEVENANAVAVQVLGGEPPLPTPLFLPGVRTEPRAAGAKLGQRVRDALGGDVDGAAVAVLVDPAELDAADFVAGIADAAPGLLITGAGASGGELGCRVFWEVSAHADSAVALVLPKCAAPEPRDDPGLSGARRSAHHHSRRRKPDPRDRRPPGGRGATSARCRTRATRGCAR